MRLLQSTKSKSLILVILVSITLTTSSEAQTRKKDRKAKLLENILKLYQPDSSSINGSKQLAQPNSNSASGSKRLHDPWVEQRNKVLKTYQQLKQNEKVHKRNIASKIVQTYQQSESGQLQISKRIQSSANGDFYLVPLNSASDSEKALQTMSSKRIQPQYHLFPLPDNSKEKENPWKLINPVRHQTDTPSGIQSLARPDATYIIPPNNKPAKTWVAPLSNQSGNTNWSASKYQLQRQFMFSQQHQK